MNVCLNEVLRCYCGVSAKEMLDILYWMENDNHRMLQDQAGDECGGGQVGEIPPRCDSPPGHGLDGAHLKVR